MCKAQIPGFYSVGKMTLEPVITESNKTVFIHYMHCLKHTLTVMSLEFKKKKKCYSTEGKSLSLTLFHPMAQIHAASHNQV